MLITRVKISKLTLKQEKELLEIYKKSMNNIIKTLPKDNLDKITKAKLNSAIEKEIKVIEESINSKINQSINQASKISIDRQENLVSEMFKTSGLKFDTKNMFSQVHTNIINDILSGGLYKDNKTLSARVWDLSQDFGKDIQYIISEGLIEKKSAKDLAKDLEKYLKPPDKRGASWDYKVLKNSPIDYKATRLARTTINHSYQTATIQASQDNPFIEGIEWHSTFQHGRTCQLCMDRATNDEYGLGPGIFPKDKVPLDHPNGLCTMIPYIPKSFKEIGKELGDWSSGKVKSKDLDKWLW